MTDTIHSVTNTVSQVTGGSFNTTALEAYPIGAIYISTVDVSPAALFGGTWRKLQGRFLLGASAEFPAGSTGGEKQHTMTIDEMPAHTHSGLAYSGGSGSIRGSSSGGVTTGSTGGGQPFNIMPPYLSVYMFERTG